MKKLLFIAVGALFTTGLSAQNLVTRDIEKKNVVLEEFTGKTCGYCPDGHKRADEFSAANPGDVVLINIHAGGYAKGTPNYNTYTDAPTNAVNYGNVNYGHPDVQLSGFPAGAVNRTLFTGNSQRAGTAQSRGSWASTGGTVLGEDSPVNVGVKGVYDPATSKLYVVVEAYYTADEQNVTNMVSVGILQSAIWGPQSGATNFYPAKVDQSKAPNLYRHDHMLRAVLTGQWGEKIEETVKGSFFTKLYEYDVPANLNDIPVDTKELEVYAFVAEGEQGILSGASADVVEGTKPELFDINASVANLNSAVSGVKVFPNPTTGNATLKVNSEKSFDATIRVVAVTGAVVSSSSTNVVAGNNEIAIDMNSLEEGMYFVEVAGQEGVVARQSVVKK